MMWFLLLLLTAHVELVLSADDGTVILKNGGNPCEGHVEVYYKGTWGYVGDKYWNRSTEEVVCRSTQCGKPVETATEDVPRTTGRTIWLNELKCRGHEENLLKCRSPGWNISIYEKPTVKKIKCSNKVNVSLKGSRCSGTLQYSIEGESHSSYLCNKSLDTQNDANLVCKILGCGEAEESLPWVDESPSSVIAMKMKFSCSGIENVTNLWQCVTEEQSPPCQNFFSVICKGHERLQLRGSRSNVCSGLLEKKEGHKWEPVKSDRNISDEECQQMHCGDLVSQDHETQQLTCKANVSVVLMDNGQESKCYGTVNIKVNGLSGPVCASGWNEEEAEMVCRELECGKVISSTTKSTQRGVMDHVKCTGNETSLWHCQAQHGKDLSCTSSPFIICSGSVHVKLEDGPGTCAGRLAIQHAGQWKRVNKKEWSEQYSDIVCKQLKCGNKRNTDKPEKFSHGSGTFLPVKCKTDPQLVSHISECIETNTNNQNADEEAVGITCEKHKVVFLTRSCSGNVGIERGNKIYWLSGSSSSWNNKSANTVCQQMHCGYAASYNSTPSAGGKNDVWHESYDCSSTNKSLFECTHSTQPYDHNRTIATVKCSENIEMKLANGCWGIVNVCVEGKCGDVCGDTWTDEKYQMLCKSKGCGDNILKALNRPDRGTIIVKSMHSTNYTTDLNQCNFVKKKDNDYSCDRNPAYVVCSASAKPRFDITGDKCSGNVMVDYEGKSLPVCMEALKDIKTQNTICRELECGEALNKTLAYFGPVPANQPVISMLQCSADTSSLKACYTTPGTSSCTFGGLRCSEWRMMETKGSCSGEVAVHSQGETSYVSSEGWTKKEGQRLCHDMNCGNFKTMRNMSKADEPNSVWLRSFKCDNPNPTNIWNCEKDTPPSEKKKLYIECQDESSVTLSQKCHGEVRINNIPVCHSDWHVNNSHMVCQQLDCGNAIVDPTGSDLPAPRETYHVNCDESYKSDELYKRYKLGQCTRVKGKCDKKKTVSVYCVNNIKFDTTEDCGGLIKVKYQTEWENVCVPDFTSVMKNKLCEKIGCRRHNDSIKPLKKKEAVTLNMALECTPDIFDIKYCVKRHSCGSVIPAAIYCDGYEEPVVEPEKKKSSPIGLILGVTFLVVLVIVIIVIVRFCIVKRLKKSSGSLRKLPRKESEFESGEYEDVVNNANEMEDLSRGRFRSEAEFITENDAQSASSLPYDDIDEVVETQPLTSPDTTTAASGDGFVLEDGVTYEVDDPQENYDDIDASPEITETKAEVHDTPESDTAAPSELEQTDDDYIVPGEDE